MDSTSNDAHAWATAALRTFWRRVFTQLANGLQKDSLAMRAQLEKLK